MSEQRLAIVTGGARGIGRAIVLELLKQGRKVVAMDINTDQLKELENVVDEAGFSVITCCLDITDTEKLSSTIQDLAKEHGGVGILVNNAGITKDKLMMQMEEADFDPVISVNLKAAFMATQASLRSMVRNKFGRIINISSVAGVMGQAGSANYSASKAGLIGVAKSVAREVGKKNITANCIAPGFIETDMTKILPDAVKEGAKKVIPVKRFGQPEDIAKAVAFLASDDSGYITGQVICVDGGMAM